MYFFFYYDDHTLLWCYPYASTMEKPLCKYGSKCYRKNPDHLQQYSHPQRYTDNDAEGPPAKKQRLTESEVDHPLLTTDTVGCGQIPFLLTKVRGISSRFNAPSMAVGIKDLLSTAMGDLVSSAQFNYLFDISWLLQQYPENKRDTPVLIVYGDQRETTVQLRREAQAFPNVTLCPAKLEIIFGTHHSKMMFLLYKNGLRVIIHTANLIAKDWDQKTQGVWISPLFPPKSIIIDSKISSGSSLPAAAAAANADLSTDSRFQNDLLEYLEAYGGAVTLKEWKKNIMSHDMSSARVRLVASVPGAHTGRNINKWGHLKLRKILSECVKDSSVDYHWPVVGQFSSIGSLGPTSSNWLCSEWLQSLSSKSTGVKTYAAQRNADLQLIFPSVDNVRESLEGYIAGGSIPYAQQNSLKQPYLKSYLCQWKADKSGRTNAAPHIKTYTRLSPDSQRALWFLMTSANLSKAAWGCLEKKGTQLKIRSYEIGVLFLPSELDSCCSVFSLSEDKKPGTADSSQAVSFCSLPYDVPLSKYSSNDEPWVWNAPHLKPDRHENVWTPPK